MLGTLIPFSMSGLRYWSHLDSTVSVMPIKIQRLQRQVARLEGCVQPASFVWARHSKLMPYIRQFISGVQCTEFNVQCYVCIVQWAVCYVQCAVQRLLCEVWSVQCAVCRLQCAASSVQYEVYSWIGEPANVLQRQQIRSRHKHGCSQSGLWS